MKRNHRHISAASASVLIALLLLFLSGGATIVRCAHSGQVSIRQLTVWENMTYWLLADEQPAACTVMAMDNDDVASTTIDEPGCMDVSQWHMATQLENHQPTPDFHIFQPLLAIDVTVSLMAAQPVTLQKQTLTACDMWHAPPRAHLLQLCTLLI